MKKELNIEVLRMAFDKFLDNLTVEEVESWERENETLQKAKEQQGGKTSELEQPKDVEGFLDISNLEMLMKGVNLTTYQRALAFDEFHKLKDIANQISVSDEEIEEEYPERNSSGKLLDYNLARREGAKWMQNKLNK